MFALLQGYKTYLVVIGAILYALGSVYFGAMDIDAAVKFIMAALAVAGIRSGLSTEVQLVLKALGIQLPPSPTKSTVKKAVERASVGARRVGPVLVAGFLACTIFVMSACSTMAGAPAALQAAERAFVIAQVLYNSVCAAEPDLSFCSENDMKLANAAADIVRHRIEEANKIIAAGGTVEQVAAAVEAINNAQKDFERIVNLLQAKKTKAMAAGAWPRR